MVILSDIMEPKIEQKILEEIQNMRRDIIEIRITVEEFSHNLQEVRPEYIEKLKKIDDGKFLGRREFEKKLCE